MAKKSMENNIRYGYLNISQSNGDGLSEDQLDIIKKKIQDALPNMNLYIGKSMIIQKAKNKS